MREFAELFALTPTTRVLDVGGTPDNWSLCPVQPRVTLLNNERTPLDRGRIPGEFTYLVGDGCELPFSTGEFDVVYSNSVIEHLGTWEQQQRFAREVRRVGKSYYMQTPNRAFPLEPHMLGVGVHWFPRKYRARLIRYGSLHGIVHRRPIREYEDFVAEVRLLSFSEMRTLLPDARLSYERVAGLGKSLIAVKLA